MPISYNLHYYIISDNITTVKNIKKMVLNKCYSFTINISTYKIYTILS